ncbi:hypothetical protein [Caulobacter sp. 17J65-9]|uniref:hypothetical protein n=1 Tax=Caulobacter sp. 17J65-9 TaxID=2709382 RepID=UPI0013CB3D0A|nr:hypothetical protein [Caulobacter sp. 17J65-9]NEX94793.1 hypothetical protein [Caulobacter sp. 17J65-9]
MRTTLKFNLLERAILAVGGLVGVLLGGGGLILWAGGAYVVTRYGMPYSGEPTVWAAADVAWFVGFCAGFALAAFGGGWALRLAFSRRRPSHVDVH